MRILHLDSGREMRGGQWQALRLHRALLKLGHESTLLAREGSPLMAMANCQPIRPLRLAHLSRSFDIIHAHDARSHTLGALFARVPLVVSRRVAFPVKTSALSRWKYSQPARFLAVSRFAATQLTRAGVKPDRIAVVYDGVEIPDTPAQGDKILTPYTLDPAKGMALAEAAASQAGVAIHRSTNLTADLPHARALVYLSRSEGLGSGILLAMAHGITVIASNTGGIPELIEDGVSGITVENNIEAVAAAFARIDPTLGQNARQTVLQKFTVDRMAQATLEAYGHAATAALLGTS